MKKMHFFTKNRKNGKIQKNGNVHAGGLEQVRAGDGNLRYEFPWP